MIHQKYKIQPSAATLRLNLSINTTFDPPQFSLDNTFKNQAIFSFKSDNISRITWQCVDKRISHRCLFEQFLPHTFRLSPIVKRLLVGLQYMQYSSITFKLICSENFLHEYFLLLGLFERNPGPRPGDCMAVHAQVLFFSNILRHIRVQKDAQCKYTKSSPSKLIFPVCKPVRFVKITVHKRRSC